MSSVTADGLGQDLVWSAFLLHGTCYNRAMTDMRLRLVLIEDPNTGTQTILDALSGFGYQPHICSLRTLAKLAEVLRTGTWDLVIVVHRLAAGSLGELLSQLQAQPIVIPHIVVTDATLQRGEVESALQAGVSDMVHQEQLSRLGTSVAVVLAQWHQQQMNRRSRQLITHLESLRERERAILAREVHDELGNTLMGVKLDVAWLRRHLAQGGGYDEKLATMGSQLERSIDAMRRIITELRPSVLDDLGITAAIEWKLNDFCELNGLDCHLVNHAEGVVLGGEGDAITVFRIFLEILTNIQRHARASRVEVELTLDIHAGVLLLVVTDDGVGICETDLHKRDSFGILRMYERAQRMGGRLRIEKGIPGGTVVALSVPLLGRL